MFYLKFCVLTDHEGHTYKILYPFLSVLISKFAFFLSFAEQAECFATVIFANKRINEDIVTQMYGLT